MAENKQALTVGLVGSGFAARFHYDALKRVSPPLHVVGNYSPNRESRESFARARNIRPFDTFEQLLNAVEMVCVLTPGRYHEYYTIKTLEADKHVVVEKPLTGYYGPKEAKDFRGDTADAEVMLQGALTSLRRMAKAAQRSKGILCYAENWTYAPSVQKAMAILKTGGDQILRMIGEESHSGSHAPSYGTWREAGGGSLMGKACHPLSACISLKYVESQTKGFKEIIRPRAVRASTHALTRLANFRDRGHIRTDYHDVEDFGHMHVIFSDDTICDVYASEIVLGGVHNWLEVYGNNFRVRCNLNPTNANVFFAPDGRDFQDLYTIEKIETKEGWSCPSPDEDWAHGYPQEIQDFVEAVHHHREPLSGLALGWDTIATIYAAYVSAASKGRETEIPAFPSDAC